MKNKYIGKIALWALAFTLLAVVGVRASSQPTGIDTAFVSVSNYLDKNPDKEVAIALLETVNRSFEKQVSQFSDENIGVSVNKGLPFNVVIDAKEGVAVDGTVVIDGSGNWDGAVTGSSGTFSSTLGVTGATTLASTLQVSGNTTLLGRLTVSSTVDNAAILDSGIQVNTNKFTVASSTGNTLVAGTLTATGAVSFNGGLSMDTNAFTVANTTGNVFTTGTFRAVGIGTFDTGLTVTAGDTNLDNLVQGGDVTSISTTSPTYTLTAANVCDSSVIKFTPLGSATTVTFPATSSLFADCLTANGDYKDFIYSAVSTSSVLAAGTGGTLTMSSSTSIGASDTAKVRVQRDTDNSYLLIGDNQI